MPLNTLTDQAIDFTSKDFEAWVSELRSKATSVFPQWTDFNKANIGNLQLELFAHTLDVMTYSIDQQTNEGLIPTARLRRSMIDLAKLVGYELPIATEASANLEFTVADGQVRAVDVIIPALTQVTAPDIQNPISFWTDAEARIVQGTVQVTGVAARNAEPQSDVFIADGSATQKIRLVNSPYLDVSAQVLIGADVYTEVENLLKSGPNDKVFFVVVDEFNVATLVFGDGVNGHAPIGAGQIDYETGGGISGNVDALAISEMVGNVQDELGNLVRLLVRNPSDASGGTDRMSVEEARIAIPEHTRTVGERTVARDDFEINARRVRGVARSLLLTHDDDTSIPEYTGDVFIIPVGGGLPSATLKAEVLEMITVTRPQPVGMDVNILDPTLKIISISAIVYLEEGATEAETRTNIEADLDSFFALTNSDGVLNDQINFGYHVKNWQGGTAGEVPFSDLFNVVRDASGVRKVDKSSFVPAADVSLFNSEFPVLGSIILVNGDLGTPF